MVLVDINMTESSTILLLTSALASLLTEAIPNQFLIFDSYCPPGCKEWFRITGIYLALGFSKIHMHVTMVL